MQAGALHDESNWVALAEWNADHVPSTQADVAPPITCSDNPGKLPKPKTVDVWV